MQSREEKLDELLQTEKEKQRQIKKQKRKEVLKKMIIILLVLFALVLVYSSIIEPNMLMIDEHVIENNKISKTFYGYKILHFSDLHYGSTINAKNIDRIINKINDTKPDIVIFSGDLIEENYNMKEEDIKILTDALKKIKPALGKYAVIGNHDFYNDNYNNILYDSDFKLLVNSFDLVYAKDNVPIMIYGVDNVTFGDPNYTDITKEEYKNIYKIVVVHEPDYADKLKDQNIDIILSGHSHDGQVKLSYLTKLYLPEGAKTYYNKYYKINNTDLYISNGIGCSVVGLRFMSPPSMNLFRIK